MEGIRKILVHRYRQRWGAATAAIVVIVAASITCMILVRQGELDPTPWRYIAVAAAILAALSGAILALVEAKIELDLTSETTRLAKARSVRRHHLHG